MSDLDELAESARNRGLKLVRSRVRTAGKRGFGKVGLTDASGKPVLGMDGGAPGATPEEVEDHLRGLGASDWSASLGAADAPRRAARRAPAAKPQPKPKPKPPPPKPEVREARPADAARLVELLDLLGHEIDEASLRKNLAALKKLGETPLVATIGREIVGLCGISSRIAVHKPRPVGRIAVLVVAKNSRGKGLGRMLVDAAEGWCRDAGCDSVEVTSNDRLGEAHAFYRHMGFERTSVRFFKPL